jgi:predicted permease
VLEGRISRWSIFEFLARALLYPGDAFKSSLRAAWLILRVLLKYAVQGFVLTGFGCIVPKRLEGGAEPAVIGRGPTKLSG